VNNYLRATKRPTLTSADFRNAKVDVIGPSGNLAGVLFCEKEGFAPLFKEVNLANRYDLMIISTKGVSVTAARQLIDRICGGGLKVKKAAGDFTQADDDEEDDGA